MYIINCKHQVNSAIVMKSTSIKIIWEKMIKYLMKGTGRRKVKQNTMTGTWKLCTNKRNDKNSTLVSIS